MTDQPAPRPPASVRTRREAGLRALNALESLWNERRGERPLPSRKDFAIEDFRPWFGHIRIVAVERQPLRLRVTLDGTEIVAVAGVDLTGRYLDQVYGCDELKFLLDGYHVCMDEKRPVYETLSPNDNIVNFGEIIRVLLPCGIGAEVTHVVYCEYAFNVDHWCRTVFADPRKLRL